MDDGDLLPFLFVDGSPRGRIFVGNSLTSYDEGEFVGDVLLGASFAGAPTGAIPLRRGAKGWIAHEAGPGKDEAGIAGLPLSDRFGVPAAAIATMEARLSGGRSLADRTRQPRECRRARRWRARGHARRRSRSRHARLRGDRRAA